MSFPLSRAPAGIAHVGVVILTMIFSAACGRPDADVAAGIRKQLANDPVTAPLEITIDVKGGIAHVSGQTSSVAEQTRVIEIARSTEGVKEVMHDMSLREGAVLENVRKALAADPLLASVPIEVDARDGYVRLMSNQTDRAQRERAIMVARSVEGVLGVEDRMK